MFRHVRGIARRGGINPWAWPRQWSFWSFVSFFQHALRGHDPAVAVPCPILRLDPDQPEQLRVTRTLPTRMYSRFRLPFSGHLSQTEKFGTFSANKAHDHRAVFV